MNLKNKKIKWNSDRKTNAIDKYVTDFRSSHILCALCTICPLPSIDAYAMVKRVTHTHLHPSASHCPIVSCSCQSERQSASVSFLNCIRFAYICVRCWHARPTRTHLQTLCKQKTIPAFIISPMRIVIVKRKLLAFMKRIYYSYSKPSSGKCSFFRLNNLDGTKS